MPPSSYPPSIPPSSYPPSMPSSSYPSSSGFRQGASPAAGPGPTPHNGGQHMQAASPHGQGQGSPFQGAPSQHNLSQHPFISQQNSQHHGQQHSQQHSQAGAYGPGLKQQQQQQPLSASHSAPQFSHYGQQGIPARPLGPSAGPQAQPTVAGYAQHARGFGQQAPSNGLPTAQMQMQPDYGPQRQPDVEREVQPMGGPVQQGGQRAQQGMSHQEMAQQAERKRRFTEQKRENQIQQVCPGWLTACTWVRSRLLFGKECAMVSSPSSKQILMCLHLSGITDCLLAALQQKRTIKPIGLVQNSKSRLS